MIVERVNGQQRAVTIDFNRNQWRLLVEDAAYHNTTIEILIAASMLECLEGIEQDAESYR